MTRILALAALAAGLAATPAGAQQNLGEFLETLAGIWQRGDAAALANYAVANGIEVEVHGRPLGPLAGRKFNAALRRVFEESETVSVRANMTAPVAGVEDRAFGELTWEVRVRGGGSPERTTVFLALVREPLGWRVTQIRILR